MLWNEIFTYTGEYFNRSSFSGVLLNNVEKGDGLICMRRTCTKTASKECGECSVTALFLCLLWSPAQCSSWITAPQTARTRMELRTDWRSSSPDGPPWKRYRKKALLKVKDLPCALHTFMWCSLPTISFKNPTFFTYSFNNSCRPVNSRNYMLHNYRLHITWWHMNVQS